MSTKTEQNLEIAKLQKEIEGYISLGNDTIVFDFQKVSEGVLLNLLTVSAKHQQSFLFHSLVGYSKVEALQNMLEHVKTYKEKNSSYTIQWSLKDENELHTSYFRAGNIMEAMEKLYFGRNANSIIVFSVVLNPIS